MPIAPCFRAGHAKDLHIKGLYLGTLENGLAVARHAWAQLLYRNGGYIGKCHRNEHHPNKAYHEPHSFQKRSIGPPYFCYRYEKEAATLHALQL